MSEDLPKKIVSAYSKKFDKHSLVLSAKSEYYSGEVKQWISLGKKKLNSTFGHPRHGMPSGRIIEILGGEGHGKSTLALRLLGQWQLKGGLSILLETEPSYQESWAKANKVDTENIMLFQMGEREYKEKGTTYVVPEGLEDVFIKLKNLIRLIEGMAPDIPTLIVVDSVTAAPPRKELEGEWGQDTGIAEQARIISANMRSLNTVIRNSSITLIAINQMRSKVGYISYDEATGGKALKYYSAVRLKVTRTSGRTKKTRHKILNLKNRLGTPFRESYFTISSKEGLAWL